MCLYDNYKGPWLLGGDFNEITHASDKFGGKNINNSSANKFLDCINYCHLSNLGYKGNRYTWTNSRYNNYNILERIDRFFANYEWLNHYPDALVTHLPCTHSDHCPPINSTPQPPFARTKKSSVFKQCGLHIPLSLLL